MARDDLARVVRRVVSDPAFGQQLKADPDKVLAGLSLTSSELKVLKHTDPEALSLLVEALERRAASHSLCESTNGCTGGTNGCAAEALKTPTMVQ